MIDSVDIEWYTTFNANEDSSVKTNHAASASCLQTALALHAVGMPIVLCKEDEPVTLQWRTCQYSKNAIRGEFDVWPDLNVAIVLGPQAGVVEISVKKVPDAKRDCDDLFQQSLLLAPTFDSPYCHHYLFAWNQRLAVLDSDEIHYKKVLVKVGVGAQGAYALLPPSRLWSGSFEWIRRPDRCGVNYPELPGHVVNDILAASVNRPSVYRAPVNRRCVVPSRN
jgi:hypothetical protein